VEALRGWALAVCAAAVLCTLLHRLFPENTLGQQGRMLLPCLFLLAVFAPLPGVTISFPEAQTSSVEDTQALRARMQQQTVSTVNGTLLAMANQALNSYGVQAKKVVADINIADDGSIDMGQITVYIDKETLNMAAAVRQVVEHRLGTSVIIAEWEENDG
jgi:hypothetical protein